MLLLKCLSMNNQDFAGSGMNEYILNYFVFYENLESFYLNNKFPKINPSELKVLNQIAINSINNSSNTILDTINSVKGMSLASVHRKLKSLVRNGYISYQDDIDDQRCKRATLTPLAIQYYDELGKLL